MKIHTTTFKRWTAGLSAVCLLSLLFSSCIKNNNQDYTPPPAALLSFVQASPNEPPLDFYLNNSRVNAYPLSYGNNIDYFRAFPGTRIANFYYQGTTNKFISDTLTLKQDSAYSFYLINTSDHPQTMLLNDTLEKPTSGNASIRFINLSPDAPAVDFAIKDGATLVSNRAFKGYSSFLPIQAKTYTFEIRQKGTSTVLATLTNVSLNEASLYTIWFHGLAGSANNIDKLGVDIIKNAYYY